MSETWPTLSQKNKTKKNSFTMRQGAPQNKDQLLCETGFSEGNGTIHPQAEGGFCTNSTCCLLCGVATSGLRYSSCGMG